MSTPLSIPDSDWTREARRSAPQRLSNAYLTAGAAPVEVRRRHVTTKQVSRRKSELPRLSREDQERVRRRRRLPSPARRPGLEFAIDNDDDDDDNFFAARSRAQSSGARHSLSKFADGDTELDNYDSDDSYNSFNLSLQKKALFFQEEPSSSLLLPTNDGQYQLVAPQPCDSEKGDDRDRLVTVYRIYRSSYDGGRFENGNLFAKLTAGTNRKMFQHELSRPLLRWVHIVNPTMKFSFFQSVVLDCPWLDTRERTTVSNVMKAARQKSDRSFRMPPNKKDSYIEPEYYEETIQRTVYRGFRSRHQQMDTLRWLCIPYFVVGEPQQGHPRPQPHSSLGVVPPQTFMNSGYILDGKHFQVAQVWVLMVGDGLLITCARRSFEDIPGKLINVKTLPPADPGKRAVGDRAPAIIVSDGGIRTWLLPADKCQTWPEFAAHFAELGVDFFDGWDLLYQDVKLARKDWPKVVELAKKGSIRLVLQRSPEDEYFASEDSSSSDNGPYTSTIRFSISPPADGPDSQRVTPEKTPSVPKIRTPPAQPLCEPLPSEPDNPWHVFTLLATNPAKEIQIGPTDKPSDATTQLTVDEGMLKDDSDEIDRYLTFVNKRRGEAIAYTACPEKTLAEVEAYISTLGPIAAADHTGLDHGRVHLVKAAKMIFSFFFPLAYEHVVVSKFWGAVDRILKSEKTTRGPSRFQYTVRIIRRLSHAIEDLRDELAAKRTPAYNQTNVPHEFIQAFMFTFMYFVLLPTEEAERSASYLRRCRVLLRQGKLSTIQRLQTVSLSDHEAVSPLGIVSIYIGQLLGEVRDGPFYPDRHELASLYWNDLIQLTNEVHKSPTNRKYQDHFLFVKQEFEAITATLEDQQRVLVALDDSINEGEAKSVVEESVTKNRGHEGSIAEFTLQSTEQTLSNFVEMERRRAELESWHFRNIETAKDRQEKAALTFTTVTVFFLPLTMLASVFGMNTNDIRNMKQTQWIFWSTAGPLCAGGLLLWLAYLGSLGWWWRVITRLGRRDRFVH